MVHDPADQPDMPTGGFSDPGLDESELRARRALGLGRPDAPKARGWSNNDAQRRPATPAHHKSRFVQDGEVPVVVVSNRPGRPDSNGALAGNDRSRIADAEAALQRERAVREQVERELATSQNHVRDLQTRLAHAELARDEAQASERVMAERLEASAAARAMEGETAEGEGEQVAPRRRRGRPRLSETTRESPSTRGRRANAEVQDDDDSTALPADKPVKWWLPPGADEDEDEDDEY